MTVDLTHDNFISTLENGGIVVVDCWAAWCGACNTFGPVYERIAGRFPRHTFGKINTEIEKTLVSKLGIEHIPTLLIYRDALLLFKQPGYYGEEEMESILHQAESLNISDVRAHIEKGKTAGENA